MNKHLATLLCALCCAPALCALAHDDDIRGDDLLYDRQERQWEQNEYETGRTDSRFERYYHYNDYPGNSNGSRHWRYEYESSPDNYNYDGDPYNGY